LKKKNKEQSKFITALVVSQVEQPELTINDPKQFILYPSNKFKSMFWDIFISICLLFSCINTPFNMAFAEELD